jgi:hypothetical protein
VMTDEGLHPVCYGRLPPKLRATFPLVCKRQAGARGLRLYEQFIEPAGVLRGLENIEELPRVERA